jgi:S-adenosylmethionine hydrolase
LLTKYFIVSTYELFAQVEEVDLFHAILTNIPFTQRDIISSTCKEVWRKRLQKSEEKCNRNTVYCKLNTTLKT